MIIGITGTDGAGKGAVVNILIKQYGFLHVSSREQINAEVELRGLAATRANLRLVANDMRKQHGNGVLVERALEVARRQQAAHTVIESIRAMAEVETLHAAGGVLWAVDADPKERYRRITGRGSESDKVTYEEFLAHEKIEMNDPDPNGMQKAAVMAAADVTIQNDGSIRDLKEQISGLLSDIIEH